MQLNIKVILLKLPQYIAPVGHQKWKINEDLPSLYVK